MRRLFGSLGFVLVASALAAPATAFAQQSLSLSVGRFSPRGIDARSDDDVLVNNLDFLRFEVADFKSTTFGAEWLIAMGNRMEVGLGAGFSSRTVPSVYADFVNEDDSEIEQDIKLRMIPFTATVRFLPLGRESVVQPYIGGGVGVISWRYSETGEFIDFTDGSIFPESFVGSGANAGPVVLGGVRFGLGAADVGFEGRYQSAKGSLSTDEFFGSEIDLGGITFLVNFNLRF